MVRRARARQVARRVRERDVRERLREVPQHPLGERVVLFREKAHVVAEVLTSIAALVAYELVVGQPVRAIASEIRAIGGRVAVAELARFEVTGRGEHVDLRAVERDGRRVDIALGITSSDARVIAALLESVVGKGR
jgi:hypothetical protein